MVFSAQPVPMVAHATMGIRHAIAKQQLHYNGRTVFYTRSVPRCCKQDQCIMPQGTLIHLKRTSFSVNFTINLGYERPETEGSVPCQRPWLFSKKM
jgi:hypothetical protein